MVPDAGSPWLRLGSKPVAIAVKCCSYMVNYPTVLIGRNSTFMMALPSQQELLCSSNVQAESFTGSQSSGFRESQEDDSDGTSDASRLWRPF